jgi:hypothetical protein
MSWESTGAGGRHWPGAAIIAHEGSRRQTCRPLPRPTPSPRKKSARWPDGRIVPWRWQAYATVSSCERGAKEGKK